MVFIVWATMFTRFSTLSSFPIARACDKCMQHSVFSVWAEPHYTARFQIYKVIKMRGWWHEIDAMTTTQHNIAILHAADAVNSWQVLHFETFSLKFKRKLHTRHQNEIPKRNERMTERKRDRKRKSERNKKKTRLHCHWVVRSSS